MERLSVDSGEVRVQNTRFEWPMSVERRKEEELFVDLTRFYCSHLVRRPNFFALGYYAHDDFIKGRFAERWRP